MRHLTYAPLHTFVYSGALHNISSKIIEINRLQLHVYVQQLHFSNNYITVTLRYSTLEIL